MLYVLKLRCSLHIISCARNIQHICSATRLCATSLYPTSVQIVALGWCFGDKAYLRSSWNILDGMLVMISVIDILVSLISNSGTKILGMLRVLRLLRTLRPLR